jgi:hypothetical protein
MGSAGRAAGVSEASTEGGIADALVILQSALPTQNADPKGAGASDLTILLQQVEYLAQDNRQAVTAEPRPRKLAPPTTFAAPHRAPPFASSLYIGTRVRAGEIRVMQVIYRSDDVR